MNALEFINKYQVPGNPTLDTKSDVPGIQPKVGDEKTLGQDFRKLPAKDKYIVAKKFFELTPRAARGFLYENSPLKEFWQRPYKNYNLALVRDAFDPLDKLLSNSKADPDEIRWLIYLTRRFQEDKLFYFREVLYFELYRDSWEKFQYGALMKDWEKLYDRTTALTKANKNEHCINNLSAYFDTDDDGVFDCFDPNPLDPWFTKDSDNDDVDDLIDAAPLDSKVTFHKDKLIGRSPKNPYNVFIDTDEEGNEFVNIEMVIGLIPAQENGADTKRLERLCREFAGRISPHINEVIPQELRSKIGIAIAFTTDIENAHRLITIAKSDEDKDVISNSVTWAHDIAGLVIFHELGHVIFGMSDNYHRITGREFYYDTDRTFRPHYEKMTDERDMMLSESLKNPLYLSHDLKRMLAMGTKRGSQLIKTGVYRFIRDELKIIRNQNRFDSNGAEKYLQRQIEKVLEADEQALLIASDPFIVKHIDRLRVNLTKDFNSIWEDTFEKIKKMAFVDIDEAIILSEKSLKVFDKHFSHKKEFHLLYDQNIKDCKRELFHLQKRLKTAQKLLKTGKDDLLLKIISGERGKIINDEVTKEELDLLRYEELPDRIRIKNVSMKWIARKHALPKLQLQAKLTTKPSRKETVVVDPVHWHESGPEFRKRVLTAIKKKLEPELEKGNTEANESWLFKKNSAFVGVGGIITPGTHVGTGTEGFLGYKIDAGAFFFAPQLGLRYQALFQDANNAKHQLSIMPGMMLGMDVSKRIYFDLGVAVNIDAFAHRVHPYVEIEGGFVFELLKRKFSASLAVGKNVDTLGAPTLSIRLWKNL